MRIKNLKQNRGFSLVELLVSFAIFGVLCVALVGFITMSARSYHRTQAMINLQVEYQIVMKILNEYIIDCDDELEFSSEDSSLTITNRNETHRFRFDEDAESLFLVLEAGDTFEDALVSRNMTTFTVREVSENLVGVTMGFANPARDRFYEAEQLIALRNSPSVVIDRAGGNDDEDEDEPD
jgi:prepilin-type N-terminal cleavage/methylation domain-containing protein